jgi:2Fe-2S ferredoxin
MCASCHCYILTDHVSLNRGGEEQAMLDEVIDFKENSRLGCQILITEALDGLAIELAPDMIKYSMDDW